MRNRMMGNDRTGWRGWLCGCARQEACGQSGFVGQGERPHPMLWRSREDYLRIPTFIRQGRRIG